MRLFLALAALLVVVPARVGHAQAATTADKVAQLEKVIQNEVARIKSRLKLTPEQEAKIRSHLEEGASRLDKLDAEYIRKEDEIVADYRAKARKELTPEQQAEWDKMKEQYRAKIKAKLAERQAAMAKQKQ